MNGIHILARAHAAQVGACIEITLVADDGARMTFTATPEQADELAEDLEEILDEIPAERQGRRPLQ